MVHHLGGTEDSNLGKLQWLVKDTPAGANDEMETKLSPIKPQCQEVVEFKSHASRTSSFPPFPSSLDLSFHGLIAPALSVERPYDDLH